MLRRRGATLRVHLGTPIPFRRLQEFTDPADLAAYLMARTEILAARTAAAQARTGGAGATTGTAAAPTATANPTVQSAGEPAASAPVASAVPAPDLAREIAALPPNQILIEAGPYAVAFASAAQAPQLLREIGRLREITFRVAGEGTGRALDLDRFDETYVHLFVWNRDAAEVVGAYRLGATDEILPRFGPDGLYTSTLFRYRPPLLERIDPALELGRSFVRREYQRQHLPLTLLWRGIGQYVAARPRYRHLFGAVSISNAYGSETRRLLMSFLTIHYGLTDLSRLVEPRVPPRFRPHGAREARRASAVVRDLDAVDDLVREIEADRKSMPVLLRQYLKLDARLLGFNIDPDFGDVLDGLMLVDLPRVPRPILERFMGRDGAAAFLSHHCSHFHSDRSAR
jgi:putative hemolysin